jgi:nitroreductase
MELQEAIRARRSIRSFLPKPVPEETIQELISEALWAPSWANTQPWEIIVVTGEPLERFKKENKEALVSGQTSIPDIPMPKKWPAELKNRSVELGKSIFGSLSIDRDDAEGRLEYYTQMYYLFDAPALVLFLIDKELSLEYAMLDVGIYLQTFLLLSHSKGLGTCTFAGTVHCPEIVHKHFAISDNKLLVIGVALGWPDMDAPINNFVRTRGGVEEFTRWISNSKS